MDHGSIILEIHPGFDVKDTTFENTLKGSDKKKRRMRHQEIRKCILKKLESIDKPLNEIYKVQGYWSSISDAFRQVQKELLNEDLVEYSSAQRNSSKNLLRLKS